MPELRWRVRKSIILRGRWLAHTQNENGTSNIGSIRYFATWAGAMSYVNMRINQNVAERWSGNDHA